MLPVVQWRGARILLSLLTVEYFLALGLAAVAPSTEWLSAVRSYMQPHVAPCDDFYKYACGDWERTHPATGFDGKTGLFVSQKEQYNKRVSQLLHATTHITAYPKVEGQVKDFFHSCLNRTALQQDYRKKLELVMAQYGGMPALLGAKWNEDEFDWQEVSVRILTKYSKQIILGVKVFPDLHDNRVNRLYLGQIDDIQPARASGYYHTSRIVRRIELEHVLDMNFKQAEKVANQIVDFELRLAAGVRDPRTGHYIHNKAQLSTLDAMTERYKPTLNLTAYVEQWLGQPYKEPVYIYVDEYLQNLQHVLAETPKRVVANYMMWELLQAVRLEAASDEEAQLSKCTEHTKRHFVKFLDHLAYQDVLNQNKNIAAELDVLWASLKASYKLWLESKVDWLSDDTRRKALTKLDALSFEINSYAEEDFVKLYGELNVSRTDYFGNVANVSRLRGRQYSERLFEPAQLEDSELLNFTPGYEPEYNKVLVPVAYLQLPLSWNAEYPVALKFASAGYTLAHEITHAFDGNSRWYDAKGNLNNWWDMRSNEIFEERKSCFMRQYSSILYDGDKLPAIDAQDENIADNAAVRIAFAAYQRWLNEARNSTSLMEQQSASLLQLTPQQLYFLGVAQVWCADVFWFYSEILLETEIHPPEPVRVEAMMANSVEFSSAYKCPADSRMNPEDKCVLY